MNSSSTNNLTDQDPLGWVVSEADPLSIQAEGNILAFNRHDKPPAGDSISQTISGLKIGKPVQFSFTYSEAGAAPIANGDAAVKYEIIDGNGTVVYTGTITTAGSITRNFTTTTTSYTIRFTDASVGNLASRDPRIDNVVFDVPCYAAGTLIETAHGARAIEALQVGDMVRTVDHGLQAIRWIGAKAVPADRLAIEPRLRPIRIPTGALGPSLPARDLLVSPQHRMLLVSPVAERMFGSRETLVAAVKLIGQNGIAVADDVKEVTYLHLMFDRHEVIFADGARSESLLPGPMDLQALDPAARDEIFALFPELQRREQTTSRLAARPIAEGRRLRNMFRRHERNQLRLAG